jgi:molybdopterin converting factor small subunit
MNSRANENQIAGVTITVRFVSIMQKYSQNKRDVQVKVPADPTRAIHLIINSFQIPWEGKLEKSTRIFINKTLNEQFVDSSKLLKDQDLIEFIPISGGG